MPPAVAPYQPTGMSEENLHRMVCDYLRVQYPGVLFRTDFAAGFKMTMGQASKHKRLQSVRAWPDLFIAEQRGGYAGLFIELKKDGTIVRLRNGELTQNKHIREQMAVLDMLDERGYCTAMAVGFEQTKNVIDQYLSNNVKR